MGGRVNGAALALSGHGYRPRLLHNTRQRAREMIRFGTYSRSGHLIALGRNPAESGLATGWNDRRAAQSLAAISSTAARIRAISSSRDSR